MGENTEVAKEFAKLAGEGLLIAVSLLALNSAVVYALYAWLNVDLALSVVLGSAVVLLFVLLTSIVVFTYERAKHRVRLRKLKSQ